MRSAFVAAAVVLSLGAPAFAHRLDEYLQATLITVEKDRVQASMRLIPGVAVCSTILADIDTNADGVISQAERQTYAERIIRDLSLSIDGHRLSPRIVSVTFPEIQDMKDGLGEIKIEFGADLPPGGPDRRLILENHHRSAIAAYLVNALVPRDREIRIVAQYRNETQSFYRLDYAQAVGVSYSLPSRWWSGLRARLGDAGGFPSLFRLGLRHIAGGPDHLLFLLALLLPAPLIAVGSHWAGFAGLHHSLLQILKVVTAFTIGHSISLPVAAMGLVRVPSRPIEVLIAVSILVSAAHALRPLFPGREPAIAAFFGLIHGLAFAATLGELGLGRWERLAGILAFNLGIEMMQLVVVAATLPSLVFLSRSAAYSALRIGGALFAGFASLGWIAERLLNVHTSVDQIVDGVAHRAVWIAAALFLVSVVCWKMLPVTRRLSAREA